MYSKVANISARSRTSKPAGMDAARGAINLMLAGLPARTIGIGVGVPARKCPDRIQIRIVQPARA